jgi:hypothetical protein
VTTSSFRTGDRDEGRRFAQRLTDLGFSTDFTRDPQRPSKYLIVAVKTGGTGPDSSVLADFPSVQEA